MQINLGKDITRDVDVAKLGFANYDKLTPVAQAIVRFGIKNIVQDVHASITKKLPDWKKQSEDLVDRKLASLYAGELRNSKESMTPAQILAGMSEAEKAEWARANGFVYAPKKS